MPEISFTIAELAVALGAELRESHSGDARLRLTGLGTLQSATKDQLAFLDNPRYRSQLADSMAGAVLVKPEDSDAVSGTALIVDAPYLAYARATALFAGKGNIATGICTSAKVSPSAKLAEGVSVGSNAVIGDGVSLAEGVVVGPGSVIGNGCCIGQDTVLQANVTLYHGINVGEHCLIHSGAVIGADGFGFAQQNGQWIKIHQLGGVSIGNRVEIGAGTTIDRGAIDDTVIADGVILDNQIQIAHNVVIGENTAIAGCTAVAGSTRIGKNCTIAGACGITGHLDIADGTHITAMSLVSKSISRAGAYSSGTVVEPHQQWKRNVVRFRQLDELNRRVNELEKQVKKNTEGQSE